MKPFATLRCGLGLFLGLLAASEARSQPTLRPIGEITILGGSPIHVSLDGGAPEGEALTYTVESSDPSLVEASVIAGRRALSIEVGGFGDLVFLLFDDRAPRPTNRIVELAGSGFYDGVVFHRVIDEFVIQGGDPTGTGAGGSGLGSFDDQYHVELQHNRTGLISMAKVGDDSNDSQFFVTEGPQRHLDFNHSIFGVLVEGEDVREAISGVAVDDEDRPLEDVIMTRVTSFEDRQNGALLLKAPEGGTGAADVTAVVRNERGQEARETFRVNVFPDTSNSPPFLADIPELVTRVDTPVSYQLVAVDVEGDAVSYLDEETLAANGLQIPVRAHPDLGYDVGFDSGLLTITPRNGLTGRYQLSVAVAVEPRNVDYQVVTVVIEP